MEIVRKINNELAIAGLLTVDQLQQVADQRFKSVLNLRSLSQQVLHDEQHHVETLGMTYANMPIDLEVMTLEIAISVLDRIDTLPKPLLVYCNNATLAAAMVLMSIAKGQGETLSQAFKRAEELGLFKSYAPVG